MDYREWAADVVGRYVNYDGAYGSQCWDTFADLCVRVFGIAPVNTFGGQWNGWAYAIWDQYDTNGAAEHFEKVPATATARAGDVAIWQAGSRNYPSSHIAPVLADLGGSLSCVSQNSSVRQPNAPGYNAQWDTGPNIVQTLTKDGLAGYLRLRGTISTLGTINEEEDEDMAAASETLDYLRSEKFKADLWEAETPDEKYAQNEFLGRVADAVTKQTAETMAYLRSEKFKADMWQAQTPDEKYAQNEFLGRLADAVAGKVLAQIEGKA